jgi:hypothetical protein
MDALDSVFVPYRDMFIPASKPAGSKWKWLGLMIVLGLSALAAFVWMRKTNVSWIGTAKAATNELWNPLPAASKALSTFAIPSLVSQGPPLAAVPKTISLIRGGSQSEVKPANIQELAKSVGLAVRDTLLTFPQLNAVTVAGIVQHTVRTVLGDAAPKTETRTQERTVVETRTQERSIVVSPPTGGKVSLVGKTFPIVDTEVLQEEAGSKQKKINADSDPAILKMMRERGLDKKE